LLSACSAKGSSGGKGRGWGGSRRRQLGRQRRKKKTIGLLALGVRNARKKGKVKGKFERG